MTGNDSVNINGIGHFPIPCMVRVQMVARIEFSTQALQSPRIAQHCVEVDYGNEDVCLDQHGTEKQAPFHPRRVREIGCAARFAGSDAVARSQDLYVLSPSRHCHSLRAKTFIGFVVDQCRQMDGFHVAALAQGDQMPLSTAVGRQVDLV